MPLPSIDALIQESWQQNLGTYFPFINASLGLGSLYVATSSWNRAGGSRKFSKTPEDLYNDVFKAIPSSSPNPADNDLAQRTYKARKSVLDATLSEAKSFSLTLSSTDKQRLESHLNDVRTLELQLAKGVTGTPIQCKTPPAPTTAAQVSQRHSIMSDLMVYALSCNLTRIFCYEFSPTQCNGNLPEVALTKPIHDGYSHGNAEGMRTHLSFVMKNLASLSAKMKGITVGGGNLLDQSLMLCTSEFGSSDLHSNICQPYIYVGKAGGGLKGDYFSKVNDPNNNLGPQVLLTAAHAVGVKLPSLGMPETPAIGRPGSTKNYQTSQTVKEVLTSG